VGDITKIRGYRMMVIFEFTSHFGNVTFTPMGFIELFFEAIETTWEALMET
jgi:hypothetical protein